jgi:hypothetical protein
MRRATYVNGNTAEGKEIVRRAMGGAAPRKRNTVSHGLYDDIEQMVVTIARSVLFQVTVSGQIPTAALVGALVHASLRLSGHDVDLATVIDIIRKRLLLL